MEIHPSGGPLGAEITGVDLAVPLGEARLAEIRAALLDHLVIVFRDQRLTVGQQKAFARRFGPLHVFNFLTAGNLPDHPEVVHVVKEPHDRQVFGGRWHADVSFMATPVLGSLLYAIETPPSGGDTLFANMYLAYDSLSQDLKARLEGLVAIHETEVPEQSATPTPGRLVKLSGEHPVVVRHPETGRPLLFVNQTYTTRIKGMAEAESRALLDLLFRHQTRDELVWRLGWSPGTLTFWDNRCTQHLPLNDYHGHRREMRRVTVEGSAPASAVEARSPRGA